MSDQINNEAPTEQGADASKALATLQDAASLVEKYAINMLDRSEARQFATQISIMAQRDERFKKARPDSVVTAMMACVELGLMPNTPQQYAHLIPYESPKNSGKYNIQFQMGYKGLLELANRTGQVRAVYAELVFEGDEFEVEFGTERSIRHRPDMSIDRTDASKVTLAYMVAILTNGERLFEVMNRDQLMKIKDSAKAKSTDSPWQTWETEQMRKTVVKRGTKLMPSSGKDNRLQYAVTLDSWAEAGKLRFVDGHVVEGKATEAPAKMTGDERRARIMEAEEKRKELVAGKHTPAAVEAENVE